MPLVTSYDVTDGIKKKRGWYGYCWNNIKKAARALYEAYLKVYVNNDYKCFITG